MMLKQRRLKKNRAFLLAFLMLFLFSCLVSPDVLATSAFDAIEEAKNAAATMRYGAQSILDRYEAIDSLLMLGEYNAQSYEAIQAAENEIAQAEKNFAESEMAVTEAQNAFAAATRAVAELKGKVTADAAREEELKGEYARLSEQMQGLTARQAELTFEYERITGRSASGRGNDLNIEAIIGKVLNEIGHDENKLDEAERKLEALAGGENGAAAEEAIDPWQRLGLDALDEEMSALDERINAVGEELDLIEEARSAEAELKNAAAYVEEAANYNREAREYVTVSKENLKLALEDVKALQRDILAQKKLLDPQNSFARTQQAGARYYSWRGGNDKGRQFALPYEFYFVDRTNEYGVSGAFVSSNNRSQLGGNINTVTETSLSYAKRRDFGDYTIKYLFGMKVPTGKSRIHNGTIMPEDLVPYSRYSYGWDFTPGLSVTKKIGEVDSLTYTTAYTIHGRYRYNIEDPDGSIKPGNEWINSLQWLHAGPKQQFLGVLGFGLHGKGREESQYGAYRYRSGSNLSAALYYNKVLNSKQDLMFYFKYAYGGRMDYISQPIWGTEGETSTGQRFYGVEWQNKLTKKQTLRLMFNAMNATGNSYNPLTTQRVSARNRYGLTAGYDFSVSANTKFSFEWENYQLREKAGAKYRGNNFYIFFSRNW
jgi:peptidoglycan hydrolase CwlO-like protein